MELARCPECNLPARIVDRFKLPSTDGALEHVKVVCKEGHWFTPLASDVEVIAPAAPSKAA
jgi:hypothetical protein